MQNLIDKTARALHDADKAAVLTGAGVSKESGVPTFRDALDGLWARYDPEQLATPQAFHKDPKLVWDWYQHRRQMVSQATPNPGHHALAALQDRRADLVLITQNVDDLHECAGSRGVIHLHGTLAGNRCAADCQGHPTPINISALNWEPDAGPPVCPHCDAKVRPDVVWFGEMLPAQALEDAAHAAQDCDVMLVVGTSGLVTPAANLPVLARQYGATVIEVNPTDTPITRIAQIKLEGPSGEVMPRVLSALDALA